MLTVRDAISDLPEINGSNSSQSEMSYTHEPETHFQRIVSKKSENDFL